MICWKTYVISAVATQQSRSASTEVSVFVRMADQGKPTQIPFLHSSPGQGRWIYELMLQNGGVKPIKKWVDSDGESDGKY